MSTQDGPILIIGTERSGSNLLRLVLDAHPRIAVPHPPHFMRYLSGIPYDGDVEAMVGDAMRLLRDHIHPWPHVIDRVAVTEAAGPSLFGVVAAIYDQYRVAEGAARWGCKSTFMVEHVDEVLAELPHARFLWLVRDPRDVAASAKRAVFGHCHPYRMALRWTAEQELARAALERWGPEVVRLVRYEDLVSAPDREIRAICDFIGEAFEPAMLAHHLSGNARVTASLSASWRTAGDPITTARIGGHRRGLSDRERRQVESVTARAMETLRYPFDRASSAEPAPGPLGIALRGFAVRLTVEARSLRTDRNHFRRWRRDVTVRRLRRRAKPRRAPIPAGESR
ncbi:sulfotransferase family protein [Streptomyces anulatus]|uniref:sulfotransferase family protein n=1 Tax=Streptomyces anulatus TaxID=1892 RepID=UPI0022500462|nr:sulfotransferase [Streptomyces anulatus]MCX4502015.1 sulfotransferase [Streptomyces anulatus]